MTDAEFETLYSQTLLQIEDAIEAADPDMDYETVNDILTVTCPDGSSIIFTRQTAARQLWLAAKSGGFHFDYDPDEASWVCYSGESLGQKLKDIFLQQAGMELVIP